MSSRFGFSRAAATRSLSFSCLLTAASVECAPGVMEMSTCTSSHLSWMSDVACSQIQNEYLVTTQGQSVCNEESAGLPVVD